jgi:hypothetical protein
MRKFDSFMRNSIKGMVAFCMNFQRQSLWLVGSFCTLKDAGIDIRGLQLARSLFSALSALEGAAAYSGDFPFVAGHLLRQRGQSGLLQLRQYLVGIAGLGIDAQIQIELARNQIRAGMGCRGGSLCLVAGLACAGGFRSARP